MQEPQRNTKLQLRARHQDRLRDRTPQTLRQPPLLDKEETLLIHNWVCIWGQSLFWDKMLNLVSLYMSLVHF